MVVKERFRKKQNNGRQRQGKIWHRKCPESEAASPCRSSCRPKKSSPLDKLAREKVKADPKSCGGFRDMRRPGGTLDNSPPVPLAGGSHLLISCRGVGTAETSGAEPGYSGTPGRVLEAFPPVDLAGYQGCLTAPSPLLLCRRFLLDDNFQMRSHVFMQLHRDAELAQGLQRLVQLDLAAIEVEALLRQPLGQVA